MGVFRDEWLFQVTRSNAPIDVSYRVGALHREAFHGCARRYTKHSKRDVSDEFSKSPPSILNGVTLPLRLRRSGLFLPPVTMPIVERLVVTDVVFREISSIPSLLGLPVTVDRLVELGLPKLGDWSWYTDPKSRGYSRPDTELEYKCRREMSNKDRFGTLYEVVGVNYEDVSSVFDDWDEVKINYGSYICGPIYNTCFISRRAMKEYPLVNGVMRNDLFSKLAPYLDLDYFAVAAVPPPH